MDASLDFTRWTGHPRGVAYRRWVIMSTGLRQIFRGKFFRVLLFIAWFFGGVGTAALGFFFSQSIAPGGWLEQLGAMGGARGEAIVQAFTGYVLLYPDVVVHGIYTGMFWLQSGNGLLMSLVALTVVVPSLITRDRQGQAMTMYLARPLTSLDYLIGKAGIILGLLLVLWTGPLLFGWLLSMLFAPDMTFVTYSLLPLGRALAYNAAALVVLTFVAMGISAASKSTAYTVLMWLGAWLLLLPTGSFPFVPEWIRGLSFVHDLEVIRFKLFRPDEVILSVFDMIPLLPADLERSMREGLAVWGPNESATTFTCIALILGVSCAVFFRRLRPE